MIASSTSPKIKILEHQEDAVTDLSPEKGLPNLLSGGKDEDEDEVSHFLYIRASSNQALYLGQLEPCNGRAGLRYRGHHPLRRGVHLFFGGEARMA
eukprot:1257544-Amorphochlora_amoeboformis.AAC.3